MSKISRPLERIDWTAVAVAYQTYEEIAEGELFTQVVSSHGLDLPTAQAYALIFTEGNSDTRYKSAVVPSARFT